MINESRLGYNRFVALVTGPDVDANTAQLLGIPNVSGAYLPGGLPLTVGTPSINTIENFTFKDDVTWVKNKHSFKFGFDELHMRQDNWGLGNPSGTFSFDSAGGLPGNCPTSGISGASFCPNTGGISLASFELASVTAYSASVPTAAWLPRDSIESVYAQDDWKFSPTLTFNLGVRWAMESPWHTKYGQFSQFNPYLADNVVAGDMGQVTNPGGNLNKREWQAPEPRVGLAWHPLDKLVVRSGFGMMHVDLGLAPNQTRRLYNPGKPESGGGKSHASLPAQPGSCAAEFHRPHSPGNPAIHGLYRIHHCHLQRTQHRVHQSEHQRSLRSDMESGSPVPVVSEYSG